jgi:hypothetical protein
LFPLRGKPGEDRLLERLLHHRESVERDGDIAALAGRFWQTTTNQQRQNQSRYRKKRDVSRNTLPHEDRWASSVLVLGVARLYHRVRAAGNS